jgi:hypothetical protein
LVNLLLSAYRGHASANFLIGAQAKTFLAAVKAKSVEMGLQSEHIYLNYAAGWEDLIAGYRPTAKAHLRETSGKYDPEGASQKQCPGEFKLW